MSDTTAATPRDDPSEDARPRLSDRASVAALTTGLLAALLVPGAPAGLGLSVAAIAVVAMGLTDAQVRRDPWRLACLVSAAALALAPLLRDAGWLVVFDLAAALVLASLAVGGGRTLGALLAAPAAVITRSLAGPAAAVRGAFGIVPRPLAGSALPIFRAGVLASGLLLVFGVLFASADGAFAHLVGELAPGSADFDDLLVRALAGIAALALAGGLVLTARLGVAAEPWPPASRTLAPLEWGVPLVALIVLFAAFVGVQFVVLFGGDHHVLETAGLTYAEYAREGFAQLLVVVLLALAVIGGAWRWSSVETRRHDLLLRGLLAALCVLTLVIVVSALHRLDLYVDAFGATRPRLIAALACAGIGGLLVLVLAAVVIDRRSWVPRAAALLAASVAIVLTALNPDALIAERNVDRFEREGKFDVTYNATLSADATPELAALPSELAERVLADERQRLAHDDGFRGFNLARARARDALDVTP